MISLLVYGCLASRVLSADSLPETPLEMLPYRVRLMVAFDAPNHSDATIADALSESRRMFGRSIGPVWDLTAEEISWLQPANMSGLGRLQLPEIVGHFGDDQKSDDVLFIAAVGEFGSGWRIHVRSWQPDYRLESETVSRDIADLRDLPLSLVQLCHSVFSPVGKVDEVDGKTAKLLIQGSALLAPDESLCLAKTATQFIPVLVGKSRNGKIERVQAIPWTYLSVSDTAQIRWSCDIQSGLRNPISGKQRASIETMVVGIRPTAPTTRLELATQTRPSLPLIAHRIEIRDSSEIPKTDEAREPDEHLLKVLVTDRRGLVTIPAGTDMQVVWLFAYSGTHLLARVPFVLGSVGNARLEVPDDAPRLEAESDLQVLRGRLIESVAARTTAYARVRARIKKNDLTNDEAEEREVRSLPDANSFLDQLLTIRIAATKVAKARKNRSSEVRINRMCDEMADLIRQYLNEEKRAQILEELKELRADNKADRQQEDKPPAKERPAMRKP